jgi:two-component system cell cycle response regulator DivK
MSSRSPIVLIVDDHPDSLAMYAFGLLAMGFQAILAEDAEIGFARACRFQPDVVVADITHADNSGFDLTRRLRDDARTKNAGIIVLTGCMFDVAVEEAQDAGCDRFLLKPCPPDALALEIRDVLKVRDAAAPSSTRAAFTTHLHGVDRPH